MKKILIITFSLIIVALIFCFLPYGASEKYNLMSNIQQNYYCVQTERYFAEFYCGERESVFEYDGYSKPKMQYGIFRIKVFGNVNYANSINIIAKIDDKKLQLCLEKNPFDNTFMCDIEKIYNSNSVEIFVENIDEKFNVLQNISSNWNFDYNNAINKGFDELKDFISENNKKGNSCECYLSIIYNKYNFETNYFWSFNVRTSAFKSKTVVFQVEDGESVLIL